MPAECHPRAVLLAALAAAGCRMDCGPRCPVEFWGSRDAGSEVVIGMRTDDGTFEEVVAAGDPVDLTFPVQGGHVLFVAARVRNLAACRSELRARLREPDGGPIAAEEKRVIDFGTSAPQGFGEADVSDTANVANVPACPNWHTRDIVDADWLLEVTVRDRDGRTATTTRRVRPVCRQSDASARDLCVCECRANYFFGKCPGGGRDGG